MLNEAEERVIREDAKKLKDCLSALQLSLNQECALSVASHQAAPLISARKAPWLRRLLASPQTTFHETWIDAKHYAHTSTTRHMVLATDDVGFAANETQQALIRDLVSVAKALQMVESIYTMAELHPPLYNHITNNERFGIGSVRSLKDYEAFCGITFEKGFQVITDKALIGGIEEGGNMAFC